MILLSDVAPGLSAVSDEPAFEVGGLSRASYRRWVDRFLMRASARPGNRSATARVGGDRRIRFTSPASGTLFRLP